MTNNNYGTLYRGKGEVSGDAALFFVDSLGKRRGVFAESGHQITDLSKIVDVRTEPLGTSGTLNIDSPEDIDAVADFLNRMSKKYRAPVAAVIDLVSWTPAVLRDKAAALRKTAARESELAARRRKAKEILVGELVSASDDTINDLLATFPEIVDALLKAEVAS